MKILNKKLKFITKTETYDILNLEKKSKNELQETVKQAVKEYCSNSVNINKIIYIKNELKDMKLFEFEIYQIIDLWPQSLLCLQLVIEEMEERFSESELEYILNLFDNDS